MEELTIKTFLELMKTKSRQEIYEAAGVNRTTIPSALKRLGYVYDSDLKDYVYMGSGPEPLEYDLLANKTGRQENNKTGKQEDRKTGKQEDRKTGKQEDRKTGRIKATYTIESNLHYKVKLEALNKSRTISEIAEEALKAYFKK